MSRTGGNPNRDAEMEFTSVVGTALRPVTSRLGDIHQRLDSIAANIQNNTVAAHEGMLQSHLRPLRDGLGTLQTEIVAEISQRLTPLNNNIDTLRNQIITTNQCLDELGRSLQAARDDVVNAQHAALVKFYQSHNVSCGLGFIHAFRIIPFVGTDGTSQLPSAFGLPLLLNTCVISNLTDHQLNQYMERYGIQVEASRSTQLSKLREFIGCMPPDDFTSYGVAIFPFLIGGLPYLSFLFVAALVSGCGSWLLMSL